MNHQKASVIGKKLIQEQLQQHFTKYKICGSIRRCCEDVGDIDIVAITKPDTEYQFGEISLTETIKQLDKEGASQKPDSKRFLNGDKIKRFLHEGIMIDLYLADESTFETLVLIRTGSRNHNIRLTVLARQKGLKLFASGKGLCEIKGEGKNEEIVRVVENTEDGILQFLLGRVPIPRERGL